MREPQAAVLAVATLAMGREPQAAVLAVAMTPTGRAHPPKRLGARSSTPEEPQR
jgi:hypothetical protein